MMRLTAITSALAAQPNSAPLLAAMGDVDFRRAQMPEAETAYRKALKIDPKLVHAYLGLARLYRAFSLYRHAYDELQRAHEIAPDDPEVQRMWFGQLPGKRADRRNRKRTWPDPIPTTRKRQITGSAILIF